MLFDRSPYEKIRIGLAVGTVAIVIIAAILERLRAHAKKKEENRNPIEETPVVKIGKFQFNAYQSFAAVLLIMALFATANYTAYGDILDSTTYNSHDLLYDYIGPKYFDELGYYNLVPALVAADDEGNRFCRGRVSGYLKRDGQDFRKRPISEIIENKSEIKKNFTDERWKQFVHDVSYLQTADENLNCRGWVHLLGERGFRGTPVWTFITQTFVSNIPVERIKWVSSLDWLFLIGMLVALYWAFGAQTALFVWLFLMLSFYLRLSVIASGILNYDWIAALVIGISFLKKEKHTVAGGFFAYAVLVEYFAIFWLFGILAKPIYHIVANRDVPANRFWKRVPAHYFKIALGFVFVAGLLIGVSIIRNGAHTFGTSFSDKIADLKSPEISSAEMGLSIVVVYRGETEERTISDIKRKQIRDYQGTVRVFALVLTLLLGWLISRTKDYYAIGLGILPFFWWIHIPFDFYVCCAMAVVIHAQDLSKMRNIFGLLILFFAEIVSNATQHLEPGNPYYLVSILNVLMTIYTFGLMAFLGYEWWKERQDKAE